MSSELRVKKLRGSGGYAIAALTDEQQSKASIGGPDLFLAPLCRIDPDRISKYMCSMCDKEYEGSPKIQYENPNEEVAPGLTLIEKGRYLCSSCGTTIAEYREFRKDEEKQGTEAALEPAAGTEDDAPVLPQAEHPVAQEETAPAATTAAAAPAEEPPHTQTETPVAATAAAAAPQPAEAAASTGAIAETPDDKPAGVSVSPIEGRPVYDENASKIGIVKRIGLDTSTNSMAMVVTQNDGSESTIPWDRIRKVGEAVLLGEAVSAQAQPSGVNTDAPAAGSTPQSTGGCGSCGFANNEGSKFCEECGTRL